MADFKVTFSPSPAEQQKLAELGRAQHQRTIYEAQRIQEAMLVAARRDPRWFLPYVVRVEGTSQPIQMGEYHRTWQEMFLLHDRCVIWSHPEGGKCQSYQSLTRLADGRYKAIGELSGQRIKVLLQDPKDQTQRVAEGWVEENGVKPTITLTLRSGRTHEATAEHPVHTIRGWTESQHVKVGDYVACARKEAGADGSQPGVTGDEAALIGFLLGDGGLTKPGRATFTKTDGGVVQEFTRVVGAQGWSVGHGPRVPDHHIISGKAPRSLRAWCDELNLGGGSRQKRVPAKVFTSPNAVIAHCIGAYFSCDGSVDKSKQRLEFSSVNRPLLEDIQLLLPRFGIQARIVEKHGRYKGQPHLSYLLLISGAEHVFAFRDQIPVWGAKAAALAAYQVPDKLHSMLDIVPADWTHSAPAPITWRERAQYSGNLGANKGNHRSVVQAYEKDHPSAGLAALASDAVYWDEVVAVTHNAPAMTYSLGVDDPAHCYLSSGILSHNTWQLIGYCLWRMGLNPNIRIGWISNTQRQAEKPVKAMMQMLTQSRELRQVFPKLKQSQRHGDAFGINALTIERDEVSKDPTLMTSGAYGAVLGARLDLLIIDDAIGFENTRSQEQRDKFMEWLNTTLFSRLTEHAQVIIVGNAWHTDDMMHRLAKNPRFKSGKFPVEKHDGSPGWPEAWSRARIALKRQEIDNPLLFARLYLCEVQDEGTTRFRREWIEGALNRGKGRYFSAGLQAVPKGYAVYTGVDVGVKEHKKADRTVLFTGCIHPNGDREVLDIQAGRWQAPETVERIYNVHHKYLSIIYVEDNQAQDLLRQWLRGYTAVPVRAFHTGKNKLDPDWGIEAMSVEFFAKKWIVPEFGTPLQLAERDIWLKELYYYDSAKHSGDTAMASWIFREAARLGSQKPEFGQRQWWSK